LERARDRTRAGAGEGERRGRGKERRPVRQQRNTPGNVPCLLLEGWKESECRVEGRKGGSRYDKGIRDEAGEEGRGGRRAGGRVSCRWLGASER